MLFDMAFPTLGISLAAAFLLVLFRVMLRRAWAAVAVWIVFLSASAFWVGEAPIVIGTLQVMECLVLYAAVRQFGLVALMVASFVQAVILDFPATFDSSAWYAGYGYVALAIEPFGSFAPFACGSLDPTPRLSAAGRGDLRPRTVQSSLMADDTVRVHRLLDAATEFARTYRFEVTDDYRQLIARVEAMPRNQSGADRSGRWIGSYADARALLGAVAPAARR